MLRIRRIAAGLHGGNDLAPVANRLPRWPDVVDRDDLLAPLVDDRRRGLAEFPGVIHTVVDLDAAADALQNAVVAVPASARRRVGSVRHRARKCRAQAQSH